jgi:hypothetical protein
MNISSIQTYIGWIGLAAMVVGVMRIPLLLDEFSEDEATVKDPLTHAMAGQVTWERFRGSKWQGYRAVFAALQFRTFLDQNRFFLNPASGWGAFLAMLGGALVLYVILGVLGFASATPMRPPDTQAGTTVVQNASVMLQNAVILAQGLLVAVFSLVTAWWIWMIELGKLFKRRANRLRVT